MPCFQHRNMGPAKRGSDRSIHRVRDGRRACPGGRRGPPGATPGTGRSRDKLRLPSIAGAAMLRFASSAMANSAALPRCPKPGRQIKKKPKSATRRCIKIPPPGGSLPHRKKRFAEPGIDDRRIKKSTQFKHEKMRKFSVINVSSL
jgi:hypothetical protein